MRVFHVQTTSVTESDGLPTQPPVSGFIWIACGRREFELEQGHVQSTLLALGSVPLVDLHISDLLNNQLPSHYDYTAQYDTLVFRRLAAGQLETDLAHPGEPLHQPTKRSGPPVLKRIDTSPVGFAVFDRVLLTVHPAGCTVREAYALKLHNATSTESRANGVKLPPNPADLMLRIVNHMVDSYLDLRRLLTRQLGYLQQDMLRSSGRFRHWQALLASRNTLHMLEDICEDQRSALQEWIDALEDWPMPTDPLAAREREVLRVRSRDVQEHIERVLNHVRRLETSSESAVQMHFSLQGSRTNAIMRTLTVLTAIFLPLNLITGVFGMNFDALPLIHSSGGFWLAFGLMALVVVTLVWWFRRNRYLGD